MEQVYVQCILGCSHDDDSCLPDCNREYKANIEECPCQENCPNGCPCPNYTCPGTTSLSKTTTAATLTTTTTTTMTTTPAAQNQTVLVLNSWNGWQPAMLINPNGGHEQLSCFTHESNSEASVSCSLTWNNEMYIFGGERNKRQISKLARYNLQVIGSLPFDFLLGGCTNMAGRKLFLCFDSNDDKRCHWSTDPLGSFNDVPLTSYNHQDIRISSSDCK